MSASDGTRDMKHEKAAELARRWLAESERVLIGAGAGMSAAAGIDYGDTATFARLFPAFVRMASRRASRRRCASELKHFHFSCEAWPDECCASFLKKGYSMYRALSGFAMLAFLAGFDCQRSPDPSPSRTSGAENTTPPSKAKRPDPAPARPEDPRIEGIRARYQQIQADPSLKKIEFDLTCKGGEGSGKLQLFEKDGTVQKAELHFIPPGHGEDSYQFYYDQRQVVFALYVAKNWSFTTGGTPEKPATKDSATEVRYYYHDGNSIRCLKKKVEGPTDKIASLLDKARTEPDDCSRAGKAQKLASSALLGPQAKDEITRLLCP